MNKIFIILLLVLVATGCSTKHQTSTHEKVGLHSPIPYKVKYQVCLDSIPSLADSGVRLTGQEIRFALGSRGFGVDDSTYFVPTLKSVLQVHEWILNHQHKVGLVYLQQLFDCDNFAQLYSAVMHRASIDLGDIKAQVAVAQLHVKQRKTFAGVLGGGGAHALNGILVFTNDATFKLIVEPQNVRFAIFYEEYPNKSSIYKVKVN